MRQAAVMSAHERLLGQLVQSMGETFTEAATIHEDDRTLVCADTVEKLGIDRRPETRLRLSINRRSQRPVMILGITPTSEFRPSHVGDGNGNRQVDRRRSTRVDDRDASVAPEKTGDLLGGPRCGRQAYTLRIPHLTPTCDTLEGERQVDAALGRGERMDLIDDDRFDAAKRLALL